VERKKVGRISQLILWNRREIQRGQSQASREETATEFPHFHKETVILVTYGGNGEEGASPFWGGPMKSQDNLLQTTQQEPVRSPVIRFRSRGVLPLFLLFCNRNCRVKNTDCRGRTEPHSPHLKCLC